MATLATQNVTLTGAVITPVAAAAGGDTFVNNGRETLMVVNGSAGSIDVTIASPTKCDQGGTHNITVSVAAGATKHIGPFHPVRFGVNPAITYTAVTSVTVAVISAPA